MYSELAQFSSRNPLVGETRRFGGGEAAARRKRLFLANAV
jgi:hypothetical protein